MVDHGADSSATGTSTEVPLEELWKALEASASAASPVDPPASATGGRGRGTGGGRVGGRVGGRGGGRGGAAGGRGSASLTKLADEWPVGMRVEVQQESDVHFGAWFEATVYGHKAPDKLRVEYEELCEDDAEAEDVADLPGLKRDEFAKRVRPLPPQPADGRWLGALSVGDLVQLSYIGGWWDVKVLEVRPQPLFDEPQWIVKSVDFEAVHTVDAAVLRPHAQWDGASKAWRTPAAGGTGPPNADMGASPGATPMEPPPPQQQQGFQQHLLQQLVQHPQQLHHHHHHHHHQQQLLQQQHHHHHQHQHQHQQEEEEARAEAMQREAATRAAAQQQHQAKRAAEAEAARVLRAEENRKREEEKTVKKEEEKKRKAEEKQAEKDMKKQRKLGGGGASSASTAVATVISVSDVISDAAECQRTDAGGAEGAAVQIVAAAIVSAQ